jgi:hypothetical protein
LALVAPQVERHVVSTARAIHTYRRKPVMKPSQRLPRRFQSVGQIRLSVGIHLRSASGSFPMKSYELITLLQLLFPEKPIAL